MSLETFEMIPIWDFVFLLKTAYLQAPLINCDGCLCSRCSRLSQPRARTCLALRSNITYCWHWSSRRFFMVQKCRTLFSLWRSSFRMAARARDITAASAHSTRTLILSVSLPLRKKSEILQRSKRYNGKWSCSESQEHESDEESQH